MCVVYVCVTWRHGGDGGHGDDDGDDDFIYEIVKTY